ncbi:MAG: glycosyltransferase family A protein [Patescibacteria group bacterium]|nr:glycosyltransferase family A protein [Patescibacteria group bacterium]
MKISIVIPVYNEGEHLAACLKAIAAQTVTPYEVIVVDNNSTDNSVAIAKQFKFVTVISERRQGVVYARGRGFNTARGEVIGRIDADTLIPHNWVATIQTVFADPKLAAVSGAVTYHDLPWRRFLGWLDLSFRQWIADGMGKNVFLYGSNMAIRRTAWQSVKQQVCQRAGLHEDFDLAIHLAKAGAAVRFDKRVQAAVSLRRFNIKFADYWQYVWLSPKTYRLHGLNAQRRMYPVVTLVVVSYFVIRLLYRSYDPATDRLSLVNIFNERDPMRVNPATFVD